MTISDIAKMAGVSNAAVSRYLNGGSLSAEKRAVIHKVVEKTGYRPDAAAQTLRTGRVNQVGVIVPKINSESVSQIVAGITDALEEKGYLMLLGNAGGDAEKEIEYIRVMQQNHVAGIVMMGTILTPAHVAAFQSCDVPIVITGQRFPDVPCVYNDDRNATRKLTEEILERGHKNIVYIGVSEQDAASGRDRRLGVQDALEAAGLDANALPRLCAHFDSETGYSCMCELLSGKPDLDGVVCASDMIALGAMRALKEAGRRIPQDVSIAGIGDNPVDSLIEPGLTSIRFYQSQVGAEAARLLLNTIEGRTTQGSVNQITLGFTLMERGSI